MCQDFGSNLITIKFYICVSFLWLFFFLKKTYYDKFGGLKHQKFVL